MYVYVYVCWFLLFASLHRLYDGFQRSLIGLHGSPFSIAGIAASNLKSSARSRVSNFVIKTTSSHLAKTIQPVLKQWCGDASALFWKDLGPLPRKKNEQQLNLGHTEKTMDLKEKVTWYLQRTKLSKPKRLCYCIVKLKSPLFPKTLLAKSPPTTRYL